MTAASLEQMIQTQILARGVRDPQVLAALRRVDRIHFVPAGVRKLAYQDGPLPLPSGQTISQPYIVAWMTELLDVRPEHHVLEIGTGSGYQTAILACLAGTVVSIEAREELHQLAARNLSRYDFANITLVCGDGKAGCPEHAPFDRIMLTAAPREIPPPLLDQLSSDNGCLVAPVGHAFGQQLVRIRKTKESVSRERLGGVIFVPLI